MAPTKSAARTGLGPGEAYPAMVPDKQALDSCRKKTFKARVQVQATVSLLKRRLKEAKMRA